MAYVFGPVPSRRLGRSLGIDPIPLKTCNWNCVYCQLGRSVPLVRARAEYIPREEILAEVGQALGVHPRGAIDWVTFVGSGEPCLHAGLGWMIRRVKDLTDLPVAVITNGSLLHLAEIRAELSAADAVLPTLDAGNAALYRRINRHHPDFSFGKLVDGLVEFRRDYAGKLWVEVMLVRGLNDTEEALRGIAGVMERIHPDAVHLNLPIRPPAEDWVQPPDAEGLMRALSILGRDARVVHPAEGTFDLAGYADVMDAAVAIITRHPMREDELERTLERWAPERVREALESLAAGGRVHRVERYGVKYWTPAAARHAGGRHNPS